MQLQDYGFLLPRGGLATSAADAVRLASGLGYPVALKIASPDILHKTDVGGVVLGCATEAAVTSAYEQIMASVRAKAPEARIDGVRVEEMCPSGVEIIIGLNNDPQFGPVIMFGLGGVLTEVLRDVTFRVLPITADDARQMLDEIKGRAILNGYRGQPPVSKDMLVQLLLNAGRMGMDLADRLDSVDLNPIVVWGSEHRVLDAKILLRETSKPLVETHPDTSYLDGFFKARSVALIGASATPGKIGNAVLDSLVKHEYRGKVFPVNPTRQELMGLKAYPSLSAIPEPVELVVVTVALSLVPDIIKECAAKNVHNMVIISGGGKELGGDSAEVETTIKRLAKENNIRIIGCNCIGVFDGETRLDTFFQVHERMIRPKMGPIAVLTQSGTVGAAILEKAEPVGVSKFVSYGNRIDVDEADLLAYLADDESTKVIACYIEGLDNGRKFLRVGREVACKKPIVVFKAGRTQQGARAAMSHTGFFGGLYEVVAGALKQAGMIAVDSIEEMYAAAKALALQPRAQGRRVAMISNGAGTMVQAIDLFKQYGLSVPELSPQSIEKLRAVYPPFYVIQNPVDVTGSGTSADYEIGLRTLLEDPHVDIVMPWFVFQDTPLEEDIVDVLARLSHTYGKPILCGAIGGPYTQRMASLIEERGVPVYQSVRDWVVAAYGLAFHAPG